MGLKVHPQRGVNHRTLNRRVYRSDSRQTGADRRFEPPYGELRRHFDPGTETRNDANGFRKELIIFIRYIHLVGLQTSLLETCLLL